MTVTGARNRDMMTKFYLSKLNDIDITDMWFQQNRVTCHTARETIQLLHETFSGRVLYRLVIRISLLDRLIEYS